MSSNWSACLLTGTKNNSNFFQIDFKILLYVFKCFMVSPQFIWLTRGIVSPPLRHSGWQVNLCWSSPHLGGSWEATAPSPLLCQGCGIPYTSGSLTHFQSAASQKLLSFLWLLSVVGEAAVYCFPPFCVLHYIFVILPMFLLAYSTLAHSVVVKCCTNKAELSLNVKPTLPGKQLS